MAGEQQSPINLPKTPIVTNFGKNGLQSKWQPHALGRITRDEHGVQVVFGPDSRQFIFLNQKKHHLIQFHFHHPSEHWVDGSQQTIELHIVHQNVDDRKRVVLGVFIEPTNKSVKVPSLFGQIKEFFSDSNKVPDGLVHVDPGEFLPIDSKHYYQYEGSLTTPEFDENVSWVVFKEPLLLPLNEVKELIGVFRHPARMPQPLLRRFVLANFQP